MDSAANVLGTYTLQGIAAIDYEDIAVGPGPAEGTSYLFVGDIGDDTGTRTEGIVVYRVSEPEVTGAGDQVLSGVDALNLAFPDGARDAETLLVDPQSGDLFVITKQDTFNRIYRATAPGSGSQSIVMQLMGEMDWTGAVAGDVSQSGLEILIKSHSSVYLYDRSYGQDLWEAIDTGSAFTNPSYAPETQGESIAFDIHGENFYTLSATAAPRPAHCSFTCVREPVMSFSFRTVLAPRPPMAVAVRRVMPSCGRRNQVPISEQLQKLAATAMIPAGRVWIRTCCSIGMFPTSRPEC